MDVPLVLNHIEIRTGFKGYKRKSSTFNRKADVEGIFVLYNGYIEFIIRINRKDLLRYV